MAEARRREQWNHTSQLLALLANAHRDPKKKRSPWKASDFHPYRKKPAQPVHRTKDLSILKAVFVDRAPPRVHPKG